MPSPRRSTKSPTVGGDVLHDAPGARRRSRPSPAGTRRRTRGRALPRPRSHAEVAARARVARALLAGVRRARDARDLGARAVAPVEEVAAARRVERRLVERRPLRLPVRAPRPADVGPFVPVEAEPAQVVELARLACRARRAGGRGPRPAGRSRRRRRAPTATRRAPSRPSPDADRRWATGRSVRPSLSPWCRTRRPRR